MSTKNHFIPEHLEDEKQEFRVCTKIGAARFQLSDCFTIKYKNSGRLTEVRWEEENEETTVKETIIRSVCHSLRMFLSNRKTILTSLKIYGCSVKTGTQHQIFTAIEDGLKSRSDQLQVKMIQIDSLDTNQVNALLKYINPKVLTSIHFNSPNIDEVINFLIKWNKGCRLDVIFHYKTFSIEDLTSVKRMLNYPSTFNQIQIDFSKNYGFNKEKLIFLAKSLKLTFNGRSSFKFKLQDPSDKVQTDGLSLQSVRSSEVFENPLLMEMILKKIDYFDVQCLRKVSRDIRHFIDHLKFDVCIKNYKIERKKQNFTETFETSICFENNSKVCIRYQITELLHNRYDWKVDHFVYCGDQLIERVVNDFKVNILQQKSTMDWLELGRHGNMLELIGNVLKSRDTPLSVKRLRMTVANEKNIMEVLPYLGSIELINIWRETKGNMKLINVPKLNQWKNAVELYVASGCTFMNSIRELNIIHFQRIDMTIDSISTDDVIYLKENLLESVNLDRFIINFRYSLIDDSLYTSLPLFATDFGHIIWYFPMSTPKKFLEINQRGRYGHEIVFRSVCRNDIPNAHFNLLN